jgi:hypothetical protein
MGGGYNWRRFFEGIFERIYFLTAVAVERDFRL